MASARQRTEQQTRSSSPSSLGRAIANAVGPQTMRAAVLIDPGRIEIQEVELPEPGPGQVRVRLEGCGVCASNVPVWEGRLWFTYPLQPGAPGHEGWGTVDAVAPDVTSLAAGDRVAALCYHAYADYDLADSNAVVKLPEEFADRIFLGEPLACAINVFRRSDIHPGQTVAIVGVGFLGALLVRLAKNAGARVLAISRRPFARELARKLGADAIYPWQHTEELFRHIQESIGDDGCDRVIEATGFQEPLNLASKLVRVRGRLIIAGYHQDGLREVDMQLWNWRGIDVINAHERDPEISIEGMHRGIAEIVEGRLDPSPMYTHCFPLEKLADALECARQRPEGFLKAIVQMTPPTNSN